RARPAPPSVATATACIAPSCPVRAPDCCCGFATAISSTKRCIRCLCVAPRAPRPSACSRGFRTRLAIATYSGIWPRRFRPSEWLRSELGRKLVDHVAENVPMPRCCRDAPQNRAGLPRADRVDHGAHRNQHLAEGAPHVVPAAQLQVVKPLVEECAEAQLQQQLWPRAGRD